MKNILKEISVEERPEYRKPMSDNICISGGADGADLQFGMVAGMAGHTVIHFNFKGHKSQAPASELVELKQEQLNHADEDLKIANKTLKRSFPTKNQFVNNLLRRNWFQVKDSERCYAVSTIKNGLVQGGTAWAVQMFLDKNKNDACECYVFCQEANKWFKWNKKWEPFNPPTPFGVWAGIGSRELKQNGKEAIRKLLKYQSVASSELPDSEIVSLQPPVI